MAAFEAEKRAQAEAAVAGPAGGNPPAATDAAGEDEDEDEGEGAGDD